MASPDDKNVFVTVGTTQFNKLINFCTSPQILQILTNYGYTSLCLQIGSGLISLPPTKGAIDISYFNFKDNITKEIQQADLVISHAGAGSCMEVLKAQKPLIVVINETLMDNHQKELAEKLANDGYAIMCTPNTLENTLLSMDLESLKTLPHPNTQGFVTFLNKTMEL